MTWAWISAAPSGTAWEALTGSVRVPSKHACSTSCAALAALGNDDQVVAHIAVHQRRGRFVFQQFQFFADPQIVRGHLADDVFQVGGKIGGVRAANVGDDHSQRYAVGY